MEERWRSSIPLVVDKFRRTWKPEEVERDPSRVDRKAIWCAGCGVPANWQSAHTKTDSRTDRLIDVHLHFKLRHQHSEHGPACPYDFDRRAGDLTRDFPGVMQKRGEIYQLRMPLSSMPENREPRPGSRRPAPDLGPGDGPVLSAAVRIVQLLEDFAGQPRAQEQFRARYGDLTDIGWGDFCWHANTTARARELVDELRRPERSVFPIAVWGSARPVVSNTAVTRYVTLTHAQRGDTAARIRARDPEVLQPYSNAQQGGAARHVIGFGDWRAAQLGARRHNATRAEDRDTTLEAVLWANHPSAVAWW